MLFAALAANERARSQILADFVEAQPALRSRYVLPITVVVLQLIAMVMVRMADGPEAFVEGVVARAGTGILLVWSLPLAFRLAARAGGPLDAGAMALAELRGFPASEVTAAAPIIVSRWIARRFARMFSPLILVSVALSLPSVGLALWRAITGLLLLFIVTGFAFLLPRLGLALGARSKHGRRLLLGLLVVPTLLVMATDLPREFCVPGVYAVIIDRILGLGR